MKNLGDTPCRSRSYKKRAALEEELWLRIGTLVDERDALTEEVCQLRAAIQIYSEVARRLQVSSSSRRLIFN